MRNNIFTDILKTISHDKKLFYKNILKENKKINLLLKKTNQNKKPNFEDILRDLNKIGKFISEKDIKNIDNWDDYKNKNNFVLKKKNKENFFFTKINKNTLIKIINNVVHSLNSFSDFSSNKYLNKINYFISLDVLRSSLKNSNKKENSKIFLIVDLRSTKNKAIIIKKNLKYKCLYTITSGLIFKKLKINNKKYKKSNKLFPFLMKNLLKTLLNMNNTNNPKNIIILVKGLSNRLNVFNEKIIKLKNKFSITFLNNFYKSKNIFKNFKKVKSIKKRLKKKLIKNN